MNMLNKVAATPEPPYYAVIFTSLLFNEVEGYDDMAAEMNVLAVQQPGFLGVETARDGSVFGITVSYWKDEESIVAWKNHADHQWAQNLAGKNGTKATLCESRKLNEPMVRKNKVVLRVAQ